MEVACNIVFGEDHEVSQPLDDLNCDAGLGEVSLADFGREAGDYLAGVDPARAVSSARSLTSVA